MPVVLALPVAGLRYSATWKTIHVALIASFVWYSALFRDVSLKKELCLSPLVMMQKT
jgi:hypothetical protein